MPVMDGLEATRADHSRDPAPRRSGCSILTTFDLDEYVFGALKAGASGFLLKDTPPADLLAGIRVVAAGDALLSPSVTRHLIEEFVRRPAAGAARPPPALDALTEREVRGAAPGRQGLVERRDRRSASTSARPPRRPTSAGC